MVGMGSWLTEKRRIIGILLCLLVLINLFVGGKGYLQIRSNDQAIRSLLLTNDSLRSVNRTITNQIKRDSVAIAMLSAEQEELSEAISQVIDQDIHPDSLRNEVWKFLTAEN
jgi:hypothetical protein